MSEQATSKAQKIFYLFIAAIIIIPIIWASVTIVQTRDMILADLETLNTKREAAFSEIRPILIRYRDDHGNFPEALTALVPDYMASLPEVLQTTTHDISKYNTMDMAVKYSSDGKSASFSFQRGYDHTPVITYDVDTGSYSDQLTGNDLPAN